MINEKIVLEQRETLRASLWWMAAVLALALGIFTYAWPVLTVPKIVHFFVIIIFVIAGFAAMKPEFYTLAALVMVVLPPLGTFAAAIPDGGIHSFLVPLLILGPIAAALYHSLKAAVICCVTIIFGCLGLIGLDEIGYVTHPDESLAQQAFYHLSLIVYATILSTLAIWITTRRRKLLLNDLLDAYKAVSKAETEAIQHRELVEVQRQKAQQASNVKSDFLANMSDELRTPLARLIEHAQSLEDSRLTQEQARNVECIRSSGDTLLHMINSLLDVSQINAERLTTNPESFSPDELLSETAKSMMPLAKQKGVGIFTNVAPGVPSRVVSDKRLIKSVLMNLVGNAVKFTERGAVRVSLSLDDNQRIRFEVTDTGIGIAQDQQERIFEKFHQTNLEASGPGLGLTICRDIVEVLDGDIGVVSQLGQGSTFWFAIPLLSLGLSRPTIAAAAS